jgi:hypothetical protein
LYGATTFERHSPKNTGRSATPRWNTQSRAFRTRRRRVAAITVTRRHRSTRTARDTAPTTTTQSVHPTMLA